MASPISYTVDDKDLDDAALWAVIDSAAAKSLSSTTITTPRLKPRSKPLTPIPFPLPSPQSGKSPRDHCHDYQKYPRKTPRPSDSPLVVVKRVHPSLTASSPVCCSDSSLEAGKLSVSNYIFRENDTVVGGNYSYGPGGLECNEQRETRHSLAGQFPSVSLFKDYQNAAMAILEKSDYTMISGNPYIRKSGWRKISFYFNVSYEIRDKTIEFDENHNVHRAEFVVRAYMQGGRFSDGWGSCERREKKFSKPNHDIPSTAETRAKNKACQDLLGIGEYRPGAAHAQQ